jgi:hypothetical protein
MTKKIIIELTDYDIDWLARIGEVWKINDNGSDTTSSLLYVVVYYISGIKVLFRTYLWLHVVL